MENSRIIENASTEEAASVLEAMTSQMSVADMATWIALWVGFAIASICTVFEAKRSPPRRDEEQGMGISSGDVTRESFYKLLLVALVSRFVLLPVEAFANQNWWEFLAETMPFMTFASAWTLLVSFFVQLVETASGISADPGNSVVMQAIAFGMYAALMTLYVWNDAAILLLYALLCCIYAALFCTLVYFGPKLLTLLKPSLVQRSGLAFRLVACCCICLMIFAARTVALAKKVLLLSRGEPSWWYNYGVLELLPAVALLIMMRKTRSQENSPRTSPPIFIQRSPSDKGIPSVKRGESALLIPKQPGSMLEQASPTISTS